MTRPDVCTDIPTGPPVALTIAGSDSGGGAGIQADLTTFAALGVHGTSAITAITAQNTRSVSAVHVPPVAVLRAQLDAVLTDLVPAAVKTGMLATGRVAAEVARYAERGDLPSLVVDPVLAASTGTSLLTGEITGRGALPRLVASAVVVTPNAAEAAALTGRDRGTVPASRAAARELVRHGARWAVVTGVARGDELVDVLAGPGGALVEYAGPRLAATRDHGTGCTFSAALAAMLARGHDVPCAVAGARAFVRAALRAAPCGGPGAGRGPVDHTALAAPAPDEPAPARPPSARHPRPPSVPHDDVLPPLRGDYTP